MTVKHLPPVYENSGGGRVKKILVVEDDEDIRTDLKEFLEQDHGYSVLEAPNGAEGLRLFQQDPDITLVLTDHNMPEMNGMTMSENIKNTARETGRDVNIIMVTGNQSVVIHFLEQGNPNIDQMVKRPCSNIDDILPHVTRLIKQKE